MLTKVTRDIIKALVKLGRSKGTDAGMRDFLLSDVVDEFYTGDDDKELPILKRLDVALERIEDDYDE